MFCVTPSCTFSVFCQCTGTMWKILKLPISVFIMTICLGGLQDAWDNFLYQVESIKPSHCIFLNVIFFQTTLAHIISNQCKTDNQEVRFVTMSATMSGVNDVKDAVKIAKNELRSFKRRTILFMDEIHRFNKLQQVLMYILAIIFSGQFLGYYLYLLCRKRYSHMLASFTKSLI